jgi:hypothetical protein
MLPSLLTTDLCSLVSNVVRLTFSVFWEMDPRTAEVKDTTFCKIQTTMLIILCILITVQYDFGF